MSIPSNAHHLLVVDDDVMLNEFLQHYFSQQKNQCYEISTLHQGENMVSFLKHHTVDLVLLDIIMPGHDGIYWLKWLKTYYPHIPVVIMSSKQQASDRIQGLELGADDYLTKPFAPKELLLRVQRSLQQYQVEHQGNTIRIGACRFDPKRKRLQRDGEYIELTDRECNLLALLCTRPQQAFSRDDISISLTGMPHSPTDRSIDIYINRLRKKIEANPNKPQYLQTIRGHGYKLHTM